MILMIFLLESCVYERVVVGILLIVVVDADVIKCVGMVILVALLDIVVDVDEVVNDGDVWV